MTTETSGTAEVVQASVERPARRLVAADVMTRHPVAVDVTTSIWDAWAVLSRAPFRHLIVMQGPRVVGIVDDRRIALNWPASLVASQLRMVGELIPARTHVVLADCPVREVAALMRDDRIDAVPVVSKDRRPVGIVTAIDLVGLLAGEEREVAR